MFFRCAFPSPIRRICPRYHFRTWSIAALLAVRAEPLTPKTDATILLRTLLPTTSTTTNSSSRKSSVCLVTIVVSWKDTSYSDSSYDLKVLETVKSGFKLEAILCSMRTRLAVALHSNSYCRSTASQEYLLHKKSTVPYLLSHLKVSPETDVLESRLGCEHQ